MSDKPKIVELREGRPSLADIPGRLRLMADRIERGETEATTAYLIVPRDGDYPQLFGWGDIEGERSPIVQTALLQHWLCGNLIKRSGPK